MIDGAVVRPRLRWRYQRGLWAPRKPAFWVSVGLVLLTALSLVVEQISYLGADPVGWVLAWILLTIYIMPVVLAVRALDLYEREPLSLMIAAFLWGACVAIFFSGVGNVLWGEVIARLGGPEFASEWSAALTAPIVEEIYKYLGVVLIFLIARSEIDDLMDGFVYGALVGLGFSVVEDVYYFMERFGGGIGGVFAGFWVRVIASGLYGHVLYTGLAGIGLAYFVTHRDDRAFWRRVVVAAGFLLLAIVAHFFWNSPWFWTELPLLVATTVKGMPFFILLALTIRLARRREHRWLRAALSHEVDRPGLSASELNTLADPGRRRRLAKAIRQASGKVRQRMLQRLHREQINLAMICARVDNPEHPDLIQQRALCASLRQELLRDPETARVMGTRET